MFRIIRVPRTLDKFFQPLQCYFHWAHFASFRWLVLAMACAWGRPNVTALDRSLEARRHRTRVNNFFLVQRWAPEAALRQHAQALRRAWALRPGDTVYLIRDDPRKGTRGRRMDAVAKLQDPTTEASVRGHQGVCGTALFRAHVIPWGRRLSVKREACAAVGVPFQKTTELAARLIRECNAPTGDQVVVVFEAYSLGPTVGQACRAKHCHCASTLKRYRSLFTSGWTLTAGRDGRHRFRRHRTEPLSLTKPHGSARHRFVDAGGLTVSPLGPRHVVFPRKGTAQKSLEPPRTSSGPTTNVGPSSRG